MDYNGLYFNPYERENITYLYSYLNNAFSIKECQKIIEYGNNLGFRPATIGMDKDIKLNEQLRKSNVCFFNFNDETNWIFKKVSDTIMNLNNQFYGFKLNGFSEIQLTEYKFEEDGYYNWHLDTSFGKADPSNCGLRKLSMSILLNDDFEGGHFQINEGDQNLPLTVSMKQGTAIAFPSFVAHKVTPVTCGTRYSLVIWVYGPKFK